jgi:hypothetical protein
MLQESSLPKLFIPLVSPIWADENIFHKLGALIVASLNYIYSVSGQLIRFCQHITDTYPNPQTKMAEDNPKRRSSTVIIGCLKTYYISKNLQKLKMTAIVNFKIIVFPFKLLKHALWDVQVWRTWTVKGLRSIGSAYDTALFSIFKSSESLD